MKLKGKKGQVEELFDDLIAFGLLAITFIVFAFFLSGLHTHAEHSFDDSKDILYCNEALANFLQGKTIIDGKEMTRYELVTKISEERYGKLLSKEAENTFATLGEGRFFAAYPFSNYYANKYAYLAHAYIGEANGVQGKCYAEAYVPLLTPYNDMNMVRLVLRDR